MIYGHKLSVNRETHKNKHTVLWNINELLNTEFDHKNNFLFLLKVVQAELHFSLQKNEAILLLYQCAGRSLLLPLTTRMLLKKMLFCDEAEMSVEHVTHGRNAPIQSCCF